MWEACAKHYEGNELQSKEEYLPGDGGCFPGTLLFPDRQGCAETKIIPLGEGKELTEDQIVAFQVQGDCGMKGLASVSDIYPDSPGLWSRPGGGYPHHPMLYMMVCSWPCAGADWCFSMPCALHTGSHPSLKLRTK